VRWWPGRGADPRALEGTLGAALDALDRGAARDEKRGRRKQLYLLALGPDAGPSHLLKVNRYAGWPGLRRGLLGSKSRRELRRAEAVAGRGIRTPLPLAAGERRQGPSLSACYLLVPFVEGAEDLRRAAARPAERRALAAPFGRFARRVHDAGVDQDDFQPNNVLRGPQGPEDLWLIDCERVRLRRGGLPVRERARLLAKLERELPAASLAERARFLRAYAGGGPRAGRTLWREVEDAARRLAGHDAARLARLVARPGRRFEPFEGGGWRGVRVAGAVPGLKEDLEGALAQAPAGPRAFALGAGKGCFALDLAEAEPARARAALARALLLAHRGLAPPPAALLRREGRALLVFRGVLPVRLDALAPGRRSERLPSLLRLLERLAALGRLAEPRADLIGVAPPDAPVALQLLAPSLLEPGAPAAPGGRAARRALAVSLLQLGS
jgi:hypothetical protein